MDDGAVPMVIPEDDINLEKAKINDKPVDFYQAPNDEDTNGLFIFDEENNICFTVYAQINPEYGVRKPESAAWIYKMLVNSYTNENANQVIEIVGNPNYELIGRTSGEALNWTVNPQIYNNYLRIRVNGVGTTSPVITSEMDSVEWEIDVEIIKV